MTVHRVFGLDVDSEIDLPETMRGDGPAEVRVRRASLEKVINATQARNVLRKDQEDVLLYWRGVGSLRVIGGERIEIDPDPQVSDDVLRLYILGAAMALILLQRGLAVFHAAVVSIDGAAVAILARTGHGKSTLAAALIERGHPLLADDILAFDGADPQTRALPGFPQMKLWPASLEAIGADPDRFDRLHADHEKRAWPVQGRFASEPMALRRVYILGGGPEPEIAALDARTAMMALLPHWYGALFGGDLMDIFGSARQFADCHRLASRIPVCVLRRPADLGALPRTLDLIEQHACAEPPGA